MKLVSRAIVFALAATWTSTVAAEPVRWTTYTIPKTGTCRFTLLDLHRPSGPTRQLWTGISNRRRSSKAYHTNTSQQLGQFTCCFLAKKNPPPHLQYKRVTSRFFAVSSYKGDKVWYDRCNFSRGLIHCVLINYPAREERDWDDVVTRISLSLTGK